MSYRETKHLRVLIANERKDRLTLVTLVAPIIVVLGHEAIARELDVEDFGPVTARERPDVALVGLGDSSEHALELARMLGDPGGTYARRDRALGNLSRRSSRRGMRTTPRLSRTVAAWGSTRPSA